MMERLESFRNVCQVYDWSIEDRLDFSWACLEGENVLFITDEPTDSQTILIKFAAEGIKKCGGTVFICDLSHDGVLNQINLDLLYSQFTGIIITSPNHFGFPTANLRKLLSQWIEEGMGTKIFRCRVLYSTIIKGGSESGGGTNLHTTISSGLERFGMIKMSSEAWHHTFGLVIERQNLGKKDLKHSFLFGMQFSIALVAFLYGRNYIELEGIEDVSLSKEFGNIENVLSATLKETYDSCPETQNECLENRIEYLEKQNENLQNQIEDLVKQNNESWLISMFIHIGFISWCFYNIKKS